MGTDIHGCWEAKEKRTGKWLPFADINGNRNYLWFGVIANLRKHDVYAFDFDLRGKPSKTCKLWQERGDIDWMHDFTWLKPSEIMHANEMYIFEEKDYWGDRQSPNGDYELAPTPETKMTKLITEFDYPENRSIPWAGTIQEFIGEDADFDECVRFVCAFDS